MSRPSAPLSPSVLPSPSASSTLPAPASPSTPPALPTLARIGAAAGLVVLATGCASTTASTSAEGSGSAAPDTTATSSAGTGDGTAAQSGTDAGAGTGTGSGTGSGTDAAGAAGSAAGATGTYSASGSYSSPGGQQTIEVELTVEDGTITAATVTPGASDAQALRYQEDFADNVSAQVVGKSLEDAEVETVASSSLTGGGFNDALEQIREQAGA